MLIPAASGPRWSADGRSRPPAPPATHPTAYELVGSSRARRQQRGGPADRYAKCLDGRQDVANRRIEDLLRECEVGILNRTEALGIASRGLIGALRLGSSDSRSP